MVKKKSIAVIPARGGSKRIKGKNIVDFCGQPMLAMTIEAAQISELFDRIIVSTDDATIAEVAEKYGVEVPFFRTEKKDDFSTVSEATIFALEQVRDYYNEEYEYVVQLMANCPLREAKDIKNAMAYFIQQDINFQISCFKYGWMNPWWAVKLDEHNKPTRLFDDACEKRSQDLEDLYCPTGAIWIARYNQLIKSGSFYGPNYKMYPIRWQGAIDIDNYEDLEMAKVLFKMKANE